MIQDFWIDYLEKFTDWCPFDAREGGHRAVGSWRPVGLKMSLPTAVSLRHVFLAARLITWSWKCP